jgi:hypothetical protein
MQASLVPPKPFYNHSFVSRAGYGRNDFSSNTETGLIAEPATDDHLHLRAYYFKIGERMADPLQMYLADIFTIAANLAGICGISIPCGDVETEGKKLPVGLQIMAPAFEEARLLRIARAYESAAGC